jgi:nucleoside-diphosphate-sugar epimerase
MRRVSLRPDLAERLAGGSMNVIVTGATGWLGLAALEMLDGALGESGLGRVMAFASAARTISLRSGRRIAVRALADLANMETAPGLIFHFAFRTRGHAREPGYEAANRSITALMRRLIETRGALGLFLPSSGAVYAPGGGLTADLTGNPYGALKHEDEAIFGALAKQLGFPAAIMRVFNLAGPFINNLDAYALSCIIADVRKGGPVRLRAAHPVWRSYAHVEDVLNIAAAILLGGMDVPVFDAAGEMAVEIGDLAARVAALLAGAPLAVMRPEWRDGAPDAYVGDTAGYRRAAALAGVALQKLERQILDTAAFMAGLQGHAQGEGRTSFCEQKEAKKL